MKPRALAYALLVPLALACSLPARADQKLATDKTCLSCHAVAQKVLGPSFKDIAARYAGDPAAAARLATKVRKGGPIAWGGPMPMPAMEGTVSEAEARQLVAWILSLK